MFMNRRLRNSSGIIFHPQFYFGNCISDFSDIHKKEEEEEEEEEEEDV
jgi:hypothetical protein